MASNILSVPFTKEIHPQTHHGMGGNNSGDGGQVAGVGGDLTKSLREDGESVTCRFFTVNVCIIFSVCLAW